MDLDWRTLPSIIAPPGTPGDYDAWLAGLRQAQKDASRDLRLDSAPISRPDVAWARTCWSCAKWMTWDRRFQNPKTGRLDAKAFLDDGMRRFGGYDAVVLWQAYPRIGFDERNQFDFYREVPGIVEAVAELHEARVRVFLAYNPWDVGTRREPKPDGEALREIADWMHADGVFLDTLRQGDSKLNEALIQGERPLALESELDLPPTALAEHALSWMQWPDPPDLLGVLRNHWLSPGHMQHVIRRWHASHRHELHLAWLNGAGMLVWENIFGSWNGWNAEDAVMWRSMRAFFRAYSDVFEKGERRPLLPIGNRLLASEWRLGEERVWTLVNPTGEPLPLEGLDDVQTVWGASGFAIPPHGHGAAATSKRDVDWVAPVPQMPVFRIELAAIPVARKEIPPFGMAESTVPAGVELARVRVRECGDYTWANFEDKAYPGLHQIVHRRFEHGPMRFAVDQEEITNSQFLEFVRATGYRPERPEKFLAHWSEGKPNPGTEDHPVVFVTLEDARAYAKWKGKRLPTEWEWLIAAEAQKIHRGTPLVWNLTESLHSDGLAEFVMLKGGCEKKIVGSDWYGDGGPEPPDFIAKFILIADGLDRCANIGFRCAIDL